MRGERPVDKRRSIPPPSEGGPGRIPRGHAEEPTGALEPRRRKPRTDTPRATIGTIPPLPQREASGMPGPRPRALGAPSSTTGTVCATTPTRVVDNLHGISAPTRVISPSRCQQPPHNVDNPLAVPTTRARAGRATALRAHWANPPVWCPSPPVTHTRTPIYETPDAHNGLIPPLCATPCFLIPSLVCDTETDARLGR